ncbi:hypothetical protein D3C73_1391890 [compost metagenome]
MLITAQYHFTETHEEIDHLTVFPAAILFDQMIGHFKVGQGDHRLDIVFEQLIKQIVIELQTGFVRLQFVTLGENTRPGD